MRRAEQRHSPRRIAKHPELSGLLPQFETTSMKGRRGQIGLICIRDNINAGRRGQKGRICTRESNDGGRNPRFAPVKFNVKDDGGKKA